MRESGYNEEVVNAAFELGIKLGALYHQFIGLPFRPEDVEQVEETIIKSIASQPYVSAVDVKLDRELIEKRINRYGYVELTGDMIYARVVVVYGDIRAVGEIRYDPDMDYPLMRILFIERIR